VSSDRALKNRTPSNKKITETEHPTASNRNHEDDEEGRHFFIPHNTRTNLFGSKRKVARDSILNQENKPVDQDVVNESGNYTVSNNLSVSCRVNHFFVCNYSYVVHTEYIFTCIRHFFHQLNSAHER
jgi:hypothetical protein